MDDDILGENRYQTHELSSMNDPAASHLTWHEGALTAEERRRLRSQSGATVWLTGLSGSGKSTIAVAVEKSLLRQGRFVYRLDGDNIRHGLNRDLGFSAEDRTENIRRIGEVAKLFAEAGVITLVSFISPFRSDRAAVRQLHDEAELPFLEVFVDAPLEVAESRDPKGLYKKARAGEIKGFTGLDAPYEPPETPGGAELHLRTDQVGIEESAQALIELLEARGLFNPK